MSDINLYDIKPIVEHNQAPAVEPPACMQGVASDVNGKLPATDEQVAAAKEELVSDAFVRLEFPRTMKFDKDPPIRDQNYYVFSFCPSKGARPDEDGCYGRVKFRGAFMTIADADSWCEYLIRNVDSYSENLIGRVGHHFPLADDFDKWCSTQREVDIRNKMTNMAKEQIREKREMELKEMQEIQDNKRKLMEDVDRELTVDDLDYYIQQRNKLSDLRIMQEEYEKRKKEVDRQLKKCKKVLRELDENHPEFKKQFQSKYTQSIESIGGNIHSEEFKKKLDYMKD